MSLDVKKRPRLRAESPLFYSAESLNFARSLMGALEHELKEHAKQLTREAGRDTITEEDMRQAAEDVLGLVGDEAEEVDSIDA